MKKLPGTLILALGALALAACSHLPPEPSMNPETAPEVRPAGPPPGQTLTFSQKTESAAKSVGPAYTPAPTKPPARTEAAPQSVPSAPTKPVLQQEDEMVSINLEDVPLADFAEFVFANLLKKNYLIAPNLKDFAAKITVSMNKPMPRSRIPFLVAEILKQYNVFLEEREGTVYLLKEAGDVTPLLRYGRNSTTLPDSPVLICQVIPLNFIQSSQIDFLVKRYLSKLGTYQIEGTTNSLIVVDFPDRIRKILEIVDLFDKELFAHTLLRIVKSTYWDPSGLSKQVRDLLAIESIPELRPKGSPNGVFLLPIDRLGEIFVFATQQEWLDRVLFFVEKLDNPDALGVGERAFVYFPKNTSADSLGQIINQAYFGVGGSLSAPSDTKTSTTSAAAAGSSPPAAAGGSPASGAAGKAAPVSGTSKVTIDTIRNCLILRLKPSEWADIRDLIDKLDIPNKQVLIEVVIGELTLDKKMNSGVEWFIKNSFNVQQKAFTGSGGTQKGLGLGALGFAYALTASDGMFNAAINALISQNRIEIISAPRVLATDNKESVIEVGTEVPVVTSEAFTGQVQQSGTTGLMRGIQYQPTGVILTVTPTIHSEGLVSLAIKQEVSEAQANTISPEISSPIILKRSVQTNLVAKDGETVFIGGLISKNKSSTRTGIPFLSQIPLLGLLFKTTSISDVKTELIVLITARIVAGRNEFDFISEEFQKLMMPQLREAMKIKGLDGEKK